MATLDELRRRYSKANRPVADNGVTWEVAKAKRQSYPGSLGYDHHKFENRSKRKLTALLNTDLAVLGTDPADPKVKIRFQASVCEGKRAMMAMAIEQGHLLAQREVVDKIPNIEAVAVDWLVSQFSCAPSEAQRIVAESYSITTRTR